MLYAYELRKCEAKAQVQVVLKAFLNSCVSSLHDAMVFSEYLFNFDICSRSCIEVRAEQLRH